MRSCLVRRKMSFLPASRFQTHLLLAIFALGLLSLSGCVRVSGGAGYWNTGPNGKLKFKQAGFDTEDYVPGSPPPGDITV